MKTEKSWWANIYVGLKDTDRTKESGVTFLYQYDVLRDVCHKYCDEIGLCITYTETVCIYTKEWETGAIVRLINHPRFPKPDEENKQRAIELAKLLLKASNQYKVSIVFPNETIMIEREDDDRS
jgi:hypothetical protein